MTMIKSKAHLPGLPLILLALTTGPLNTAAAEEAFEFSEAETLLWMTDQLKTIENPTVLHYEFRKTGTYERGFNDIVELTVNKVHDDGMKSTSLKFFTGERNFKVPPAERTNVNHVLGVYLEGDVYEMNRLTDREGTAKERWRYFMRRIKFALADAADVKPITIEFEGQRYDAKKVIFRPYVNDPKRNLFEEFAEKRYEVVVSDKLPGYLYRIDTLIPGDGEEPLIRETLQLVRSETPIY